MLPWIKRLTAPPIFEDNEEETRDAGLLNIILWTILGIFLPVAPLLIIFNETITDVIISAVIVVLLILFLLGLHLLMRRGRVRLASTILPTVILVTITAVIYFFGGIRTPGSAGYLLVIFIAGLLLGGRGTLIFSLLSMLSALSVFLLHYHRITAIEIRTYLDYDDLFLLLIFSGLMAALATLTMRNLTTAVDSARRSERAVSEQHRELQASQAALQTHTHQLERHSRYLKASADVAREAAAVLDLQILLKQIVTLVSERFGFYHTGIFLLNTTGTRAILEAASSAGGQQMLARGYQLEVADEETIGYVTQRGEPRIAQDTDTETTIFNNPDLPETRSQIALPLQAHGKIIGALDIQSVEARAFSEDDMVILQTLADQVALTIDNVQLFQQAQESLEAERRAYGELSREAWRELLSTHREMAFLSDERGISPAGDLWEPRMEMALRDGKIAPGDEDETTLAIPIKMRGQVIGVIDAHKPDDTSRWTADEIDLMKLLTGQLSIALESARLYEVTQRRAAQEQLTSEITARMRETLDIESVLQTAALEIRKVLDLAEVEVRMGTQSQSDTNLTSGEERE